MAYSLTYYYDGDYGVTVNTWVCGTYDSGSIPDSRPIKAHEPECVSCALIITINTTSIHTSGVHTGH